MTHPFAEAVYYAGIPWPAAGYPGLTLTGVRSDGLPVNAPYYLGTNAGPTGEYIGTTTVTWTVTDIEGNIGTCEQPVTTHIAAGYPLSCPAPRTAKEQLLVNVGAIRDDPETTDDSKFKRGIQLSAEVPGFALLGYWGRRARRPKPGSAGENVFKNEKSVASQLMPLQIKYPAVVPILYRMIDADREIAELAIAEALARRNGVVTSKIKSAQTYMAKAELEVLRGRLTYAIDNFKNAWKSANGA